MQYKEELADFIIKNLIFVSLFILLIASITTYVVLPNIKTYKEGFREYKKSQIQNEKIISTQIQIQQTIKDTANANKKIIDFSKTNIDEDFLQNIYQDAFTSLRVTLNSENISVDKLFRISNYKFEGISDGTQNITDFISTINTKVQNIQIVLPITFTKIDPNKNYIHFIIHADVTKSY